MRLTKNRLEAFSDGVIAIIITIMVLSIPLPPTFASADLLRFLLAIFIYFISFIVVGAFWNSHHRIFASVNQVTVQIVWSNLFFLFFLSLIPIFTKWVIENPGKLIPAIGYDLVFILVNLCFMLIFRAVIKSSENARGMVEQRKQAADRMKHEAPPGATWMHFAAVAAAAAVIIAGSILIPFVSTVFLLGLPVVFSLMNLFTSHDNRGGQPGRDRRKDDRQGETDETKQGK